MGHLDGKVAFITGAGRGQGRSHAVALARAGAEVVAVDICRDVAEFPYPMATRADLDETARLVRALGRRVVTAEADVRSPEQLATAVQAGAAELGHIDIVLANAGGITWGEVRATPLEVFRTTLEVNLTGVWNTLEATTPVMVEQGTGGSVVITGSTNSFTGKTLESGAGARSYVASKHGVVGLMRSYALHLAPHRIRVNVVEPTGVTTDFITNDRAKALIESHVQRNYDLSNLLDVWAVEPEDISAAVEWLVSDEARYVTGIELPVDAGHSLK